MKLLVTYSSDVGVKDFKVIADNDHEEAHLKEAMEKIIAVLGPSTTITKIIESGTLK